MTKHLSKEIIQKIRKEVLAGKNKYRVARELGISKTAVYTHTIDIPSDNNRGKTLSKEILDRIRKEIHQGKSKYQIAKEMNISPNAVYRLTKDLPNKYKRQPYISGKPLELLKELLKKGFVYTGENRNALRSLQKYFPVIKRGQFKNKSIFYLEDKSNLALKEMIKQNTSRIINYHVLANLSKVFNTSLTKSEKKQFFGKNNPKNLRSNNKSKTNYKFFSKEKQTKIDDFFGRFLHSEVL